MLNKHFHDIFTLFLEKINYPYTPLSVGMVVLSSLYFFPVIEKIIIFQVHLSRLAYVRQELESVNLSDLLYFSLSLFLLIMAYGLWLKLKSGWLISILVLTFMVIYHGYLEHSRQIFLLLYNLVMVILLFINRKHFNHINIHIETLIALLSLLILFSYAVFGTYYLGDQFLPKITTLSDAFYVSVVTMTTVGFGDFLPQTQEARLFVVSIIIFSISVLSTAIGATIVPALIHKVESINKGKRKKMNRKDHFIIVGYSALSSNTYRELYNRNEKITVILKSPPDRDLFINKDADIIIGDGSDLDVLIEAGIKDAKAILALLDDDSENAFVILAVKELKLSVKTVLAVNERKHLKRVRRVHPDMILAPQVLGGELLANMLMGEHIDIKNIMGHLLGQKDKY